MKKLFENLYHVLTSGKDAVLVTIVASSGSTPRGAGARMLVTKDGRIYGTIGGGMVEYRSEQIAREVLASKGSRNESFRLYKNQVADLGMICGGDVDVYFHYIPEGDRDVISLVEKATVIFDTLEPSWIITEITDGQNGTLSVYGKKSGLLGASLPQEVIDSLAVRPVQCRCGDRVFYCEKLLQPGKVYIFGGGHIAQELVPVLARVGFHCTVIEDRPEFARPELFSGAKETRLIEMDRLDELVPEITEDDCICVMTRGHKDDFEVQRVMLKSPAHYIGVIGSRSKIEAVSARLEACGYTEKDLQRITTPIGLAIGAETPAEIAISVAAQLILVRAEYISGKTPEKGAAVPVLP